MSTVFVAGFRTRRLPQIAGLSSGWVDGLTRFLGAFPQRVLVSFKTLKRVFFPSPRTDEHLVRSRSCPLARARFLQRTEQAADCSCEWCIVVLIRPSFVLGRRQTSGWMCHNNNGQEVITVEKESQQDDIVWSLVTTLMNRARVKPKL